MSGIIAMMQIGFSVDGSKIKELIMLSAKEILVEVIHPDVVRDLME